MAKLKHNKYNVVPKKYYLNSDAWSLDEIEECNALTMHNVLS